LNEACTTGPLLPTIRNQLVHTRSHTLPVAYHHLVRRWLRRSPAAHPFLLEGGRGAHGYHHLRRALVETVHRVPHRCCAQLYFGHAAALPLHGAYSRLVARSTMHRQYWFASPTSFDTASHRILSAPPARRSLSGGRGHTQPRGCVCQMLTIAACDQRAIETRDAHRR
jgi:hypothetical protein